MPPKPTCKVVKREGQRGARIDPKGCKVRTTKDAQGNKKKETKQGHEKIKRTTTKRDMRLAVAGSPQRHIMNDWNNKSQPYRSNYKSRHNMIYDTGANITSMTPTTLQHIGYNPNRTTNVYHVGSGDASGNVTRRKVLLGLFLFVALGVLGRADLAALGVDARATLSFALDYFAGRFGRHIYD